MPDCILRKRKILPQLRGLEEAVYVGICFLSCVVRDSFAAQMQIDWAHLQNELGHEK